jgi:GNT-I family
MAPGLGLNPVVVFTVHNRPQYLTHTLASWARVRGIGDADLIFCCEPGCPEAAALCAATSAWARSATVVINPVHYGVLSNPWHALETGFTSGAGFVILAEEDTPVADDVLEFFTWARAEYEPDGQVAAVCAHSLDGPLANNPSAVFRCTMFSPIVWGTWAGRWYGLLRDTWDHDYSHNGWDWHVNGLLVEHGLRVVKPVLSRSQHIGEHGGSHCTTEFFPQTVAESFRAHYDPQAYQETG